MCQSRTVAKTANIAKSAKVFLGLIFHKTRISKQQQLNYYLVEVLMEHNFEGLNLYTTTITTNMAFKTNVLALKLVLFTQYSIRFMHVYNHGWCPWTKGYPMTHCGATPSRDILLSDINLILLTKISRHSIAYNFTSV